MSQKFHSYQFLFANQNVNTRSFKFGRGKDVGQRTNMSYMFQSVLQQLKSEYPYVGLSFRAGWFARPEHLKNHMIIHSEDKPFSCNICEKSFRDSGTLVRHKKIHNSVRPFSCEFCTRTFVQGSNFRKHQMLFKTRSTSHALSVQKHSRKLRSLKNMKIFILIVHDDTMIMCIQQFIKFDKVQVKMVKFYKIF